MLARILRPTEILLTTSPSRAEKYQVSSAVGEVTDKIILKYNAVVGVDPMPRIREIVAVLSLRIDDVVEERLVAGRRFRRVHVSGEPAKLNELAERLRRLPSITAKRS
jgi:hypothetical protein